MMLASTVQFSRYGRSRPPDASRRGLPVLAEDKPWCLRHRSGRSLRTQQRARPARPPDPRSVLPVLTGSRTNRTGNDARTE
jgi:hypothetical protein